MEKESQAGIWEDFIDIFYAPSTVFRRREHGSVFIPMLVVTVLTAAIFYLNSGALRPMFDAEFDRNMAAAMRDNPKLQPEMVEQMRAFTSRVGQIGVLERMAHVLVEHLDCVTGDRTCRFVVPLRELEQVVQREARLEQPEARALDLDVVDGVSHATVALLGRHEALVDHGLDER